MLPFLKGHEILSELQGAAAFAVVTWLARPRLDTGLKLDGEATFCKQNVIFSFFAPDIVRGEASFPCVSKAVNTLAP